MACVNQTGSRAPVPHSNVRLRRFIGHLTGNVVVGLYSSKVNGVCTTQVGSNATFAASANVNGTLTAATSFVGALSGTYYYKISYAGRDASVAREVAGAVARSASNTAMISLPSGSDTPSVRRRGDGFVQRPH